MKIFEMMAVHRSRFGWAGALLSVMLLGACEGENLFDPSENPRGEPRVSLSGPNGTLAGQTLNVQVSGTAGNGLSRIDVSVRGAVARDTSLQVSGQQGVATLKLVLPATLTDTLLVVNARAVDLKGFVGQMASDTFLVFGPPILASLTGTETVAAGATATLSLSAVGLRPISQISVGLRGALTSNEFFSISPASNNVTRSLNVTLPAVPQDTLLRVDVTLTDVNGLSSTQTVNVPLLVTGPVATLLAPDFAEPGSNMELEVDAVAMRGVASIRIELSGATNLTKTETIQLPATSVTRRIAVMIPGSTSGTNLRVDAYAIDKAGMPSAPATAFVTLASGSPTINSLSVLRTEVVAGELLDVTVSAFGPRPITKLTVLLRGAGVEVTEEVTITPALNSLTRHVVALETPDNAAGTATVYAFVTDEAGQVSDIAVGPTVTVNPATPDEEEEEEEGGP